jgi:copper chaperone CopZ
MSALERRFLPVQGMQCGGCEQAVVRALTALPGVESARADHVAEDVEISYDPAAIGVDELRAAVAAAGFHSPAA